MKTVAIHQPNYIPWAGYFYKMLKADIFVVLDDVLHSKSSYTNRVNIKTPNGVKRLTVPLAKKEIPINEVPISKDRKWQDKHIKLIHDSYCKASFFNDYYESIKEHYDNKPWKYLSKLNLELIRLLKDFFEIDTKLIKSSDLAIVEQDKSQRNLEICKELGAHIYLSGDGGGRQYNLEKQFEKEGIKIQYTNFVHPIYPQLWGGFEKGLSALDLLFNCGPESKKVLLDAQE